jgi:SAM-dependent methyltransferase
LIQQRPFLFHELPGPIRQRVIEECYRVLQPGGLLVLCDSMQAADDPDFAPMLSNFPVMFHEPFYTHYLTDNLGDRLQQAGFGALTTNLHFVSKYWITEKPQATPLNPVP